MATNVECQSGAGQETRDGAKERCVEVLSDHDVIRQDVGAVVSL